MLTPIAACEPGVKASNRGPELAQAVCTIQDGAFVNIGEASPETLAEVEELFSNHAKTKPTCMLSKNGDPVNFRCVCKPGFTPHEGSLGIIDFGNPKKVSQSYDPRRKLERACAKELWSQCGSFEETIRRNCGQGWNNCSVEGRAHLGDGGYHAFLRKCDCEDGRSWYDYSLTREKVSFSAEAAESLCEKELTQCAPDKGPGPEPSPMVPDASVIVRELNCTGGEGAAEGVKCTVLYESGALRTSCNCAGSEESKQESMEDVPSYAEIRESCHAGLKDCSAGST